jgi:hypothetical protein
VGERVGGRVIGAQRGDHKNECVDNINVDNENVDNENVMNLVVDAQPLD